MGIFTSILSYFDSEKNVPVAPPKATDVHFDESINDYQKLWTILDPNVENQHFDLQKAFDVARDLMNQGHWAACIEVYQNIASRYGEQRSLCDGQIAFAYTQMGETEKAIDYYHAARVHGADIDWADEQMWSVCSIVLSNDELDNQKKSYIIKRYLVFYRNGIYAQKAYQCLNNLNCAI